MQPLPRTTLICVKCRHWLGFVAMAEQAKDGRIVCMACRYQEAAARRAEKAQEDWEWHKPTRDDVIACLALIGLAAMMLIWSYLF